MSNYRQSIFKLCHYYLCDECQWQGVQLGQANGMPMSLEAIVNLLRTRRIQFLGLTGTGLDDLDGLMLAGALYMHSYAYTAYTANTAYILIIGCLHHLQPIICLFSQF